VLEDRPFSNIDSKERCSVIADFSESCQHANVIDDRVSL
jgi:hypothetical protein